MSFDLYLKHPVSGERLEAAEKHDMRGGTYCLGGTRDLSLNVTYNYSPHFYRAFPQEPERLGIRWLYGHTGAESIPVLKAAIEQLKDDASTNYWEPTEGNAKAALCQLLALSQMRPDGVWDGD